MCKGTDVLMDLMADMFMIFLILLCWLYAYFPQRLLQSGIKAFMFRHLDLMESIIGEVKNKGLNFRPFFHIYYNFSSVAYYKLKNCP